MFLDGVMTVFYLFVREKFQWTIRDFTIYETVYQIKSLLGSIIGFLLLRKVRNISTDFTIFKLELFQSIGLSFVGGHFGNTGLFG